MYRIVCILLTLALVLVSGACAPTTNQEDRDVIDLSPLHSPTPAIVDSTPEPTPTMPAYITPTPALPVGQTTPATNQEQLYTVVCEAYLNLRAKADAQSEVLDKLYNGEQVRVLKFTGKFAQVKRVSDAKTGYILAGYLQSNQTSHKIVKPVLAYTYDQMQSDLQALAQQYSRLHIVSAGKSAQDRDITVAVIGDTNAAHHVLIQAGIHGREHMTSLLAMRQIEYALTSNDLGDDVCFHVIPMSNPDGIAISQSAKETDALKAFYQKDTAAGYTEGLSLTQYLYQWKANANGVDLNRNFDAGWERIDTRPAASSYNYRGTAPESEPETKALVSYTKQYDFDATISYHATGSIIYWEFGDNSPVNEASKRLGEAVSLVTSYPLEGDSGTSFGGYKDWAIEQQGIPSLTVEIGTRSCPLPVLEFDTIWERNRGVFEAVANWARSNG